MLRRRRRADFDRIRYRRHDASVFLYAFDLIELNGDDLRREPLEARKATLASVLAKAAPGLRLNEHIEADGPTVFAHACKMGLEGIVSKRTMRPAGFQHKLPRPLRAPRPWRAPAVDPDTFRPPVCDADIAVLNEQASPSPWRKAASAR